MLTANTLQAQLDNLLHKAAEDDRPWYEGAQSLPLDMVPAAAMRSLASLKACGEDIDALLSHVVAELPAVDDDCIGRSILTAASALQARATVDLNTLSVLVLRHMAAHDTPAGESRTAAPEALEHATRDQTRLTRQAMSNLLMATMEMHTATGRTDAAYVLAEKALAAIGKLRSLTGGGRVQP